MVPPFSSSLLLSIASPSSISSSGGAVRVGRVVRGKSGSICTSLCLLRRVLSNEWQYHGVNMCENRHYGML